MKGFTDFTSALDKYDRINKAKDKLGIRENKYNQYAVSFTTKNKGKSVWCVKYGTKSYY